ncbi:MAG: POTRA domain-containing protein, partial [Bacteroidota bacterium]
MQSGTSRLFFYFLLFLLIGLPAAGYSQSTDSSLVVIKRLIITGNHITKPQVITREMMIQEGDTLEAALLQKVLSRSKDNIMNLGIFNFVDITSASDNVAGITVLVNVAE